MTIGEELQKPLDEQLRELQLDVARNYELAALNRTQLTIGVKVHQVNCYSAECPCFQTGQESAR